LSRRAATLVVSWALLAACSTGGAPVVAAPQPSLSVGAKTVPSAGVGTVAEALRLAGVEIPTGRVLSVRTHRALGPDTRPGRVLVDGQPTLPAAPIAPGAVITVERGGDETEPLETVTVPVPANKGIASLRVGSHPGTIRVTRGAISHELLSSAPVKAAFDGTLISSRPIALTFDDGPSPKYTGQILDVLARAHVHATFCIIARQAAQYPALVRRIVVEGHKLCNHTFDHDEHLARKSPAQIRAALIKAQEVISEASGGVAPTFFRAPGGNWSPQLEQIARSLHLTPLKWNVDPDDWKRPGVARIQSRVVATSHPGSIVLLHDGGGNRDQTVVATRYFLAKFQSLKYSFWVPRT
jgi:peptidoglycan/xylan/chitin deacetylase (PgdA/CDA1 family)